MRSDKHTAGGERNTGRRKLALPGKLAIFGVVVIVIAAGSWAAMEIGMRPVNIADTSRVSVTIPQGSGTEAIATILEDADLIGNKTLFRIRSRLDGSDGQYKAGAYMFTRDMSMRSIMAELVNGAAALTKRFTVPEGLTVMQTAEILAETGIASRNEFLIEAATGDFGSYRFLEGAVELEGFLYPETYDVYDDASAHDVINRMLAQFDKLFTEEYYGKAEALGLSVGEVVTIASLIERETRVPEERALVASVIMNRIAAGMPLQIDATVQYALGENKDRLNYVDLEVDSPYNTYKITGLPPGPICSPRIECIEAALNPANTNYIYYVLAPELDGRHNFTKNYDEFLRFKDAYMKAI
jgi:UPF0755 protein